MKLKYLTPAALCLACAMPAHSQEFSYTFAQASLHSVDIDGEDASGFALGLSGAVHKNVFLMVSLSGIETDDEYLLATNEVDEITLRGRSFGVGFNYPIAEKTDILLTAEKVKQTIEAGSLSENADGEAYGLGLRSMIAPKIEIIGLIQNLKGDDDSETGYAVAARYYITNQLSVGGGLASSDDVDQLSASIRFEL